MIILERLVLLCNILHAKKFKDDENISKNICMHIAATEPKSMTSNDLDEKIIEREKGYL